MKWTQVKSISARLFYESYWILALINRSFFSIFKPTIVKLMDNKRHILDLNFV